MNYKITLYGKRGAALHEQAYADQQAMFNDCLRLMREYPQADSWKFGRLTP